jgi:hypothetical protein
MTIPLPAMNCLKAFVDKDYTAMAAIFGDSISIKLDGYAAKAEPRQRLKSIIGTAAHVQ